eukprot:6463285-Amphidinium_carterae.1
MPLVMKDQGSHGCTTSKTIPSLKISMNTVRGCLNGLVGLHAALVQRTAAYIKYASENMSGKE